MSVINQMLKDLEKRQPHGEDEHNAVTAEGAVRTNPINQGLVAVIVILLLVIIAVGVFIWRQPWLSQMLSAPQTQEQQPMQTSTMMQSNAVLASAATVSPKVSREGEMTSANLTESSSPESSNPESSDLASSNPELSASDSSTSQSSTMDLVSRAEPRLAQTQPSIAKASSATTLPVKDNSTNPQFEPLKTRAETLPASAIDNATDRNSNRVSTSTQARSPISDMESQSENSEKRLDIKRVQVAPADLAQQAYEKGMGYLQEQDTQNARTMFEKALTYKGDFRQAQKQLIIVLYSYALNRDALIWLNQGLKQRPDDYEFRLMAAKLLHKSDQPQQALSYLQGGQPNVINNIDYYALQAGLAQQVKDYQQAKATYQLLTQAFPEQSRFWLGLGVSYEQLSEHDAAISAYRQSIKTGRLSSQSTDFARKRLSVLGG